MSASATRRASTAFPRRPPRAGWVWLAIAGLIALAAVALVARTGSRVDPQARPVLATLAEAETAVHECLAASMAYGDAARTHGLTAEADLAEQLIRSSRRARDAHATLRPALADLLTRRDATLDDVIAAAADLLAASREARDAARLRRPRVPAGLRAPFARVQAAWESAAAANERLCAALRACAASRRGSGARRRALRQPSARRRRLPRRVGSRNRPRPRVGFARAA